MKDLTDVTRDPREDPAPGDILRLHGAFVTILDVKPDPEEVVTYSVYLVGDMMLLSIADFRARYKDAEIIRLMWAV